MSTAEEFNAILEDQTLTGCEDEEFKKIYAKEILKQIKDAKIEEKAILDKYEKEFEAIFIDED